MTWPTAIVLCVLITWIGLAMLRYIGLAFRTINSDAEDIVRRVTEKLDELDDSDNPEAIDD